MLVWSKWTDSQWFIAFPVSFPPRSPTSLCFLEKTGFRAKENNFSTLETLSLLCLFAKAPCCHCYPLSLGGNGGRVWEEERGNYKGPQRLFLAPSLIFLVFQSDQKQHPGSGNHTPPLVRRSTYQTVVAPRVCLYCLGQRGEGRGEVTQNWIRRGAEFQEAVSKVFSTLVFPLRKFIGYTFICYH